MDEAIKLISSNDLQESYVRLYSQMRKYIWEYPIVELLAELEVMLFTAFADHETVTKKLNELKSAVRYTDAWAPDETLQSCFTNLDELLQGSETYVPLTSFKEVNAL